MEPKEALEILNGNFWNWISEAYAVEPNELEALQIAIDVLKEKIKSEEQ